MLLLLGIGVFGGIIGAWLFQKLRIPQVVGYIAIGLLIGQSGFNIVQSDDIVRLQSFNWFALGIIGFLVGGELQIENFRKYGKQFMFILFGEGLATFFLVGSLVSIIVFYVIHSWAPALAAGIVFGAIASATDPASTMQVLWEYRARGVLTTALIAIVALDDALALFLYGIGTSLAEMLTGGSSSITMEIIKIGKELLGSLLLGTVAGFTLDFTIKLLREQKERMLALAIGMLLLVIGLANAAELDVIIVTMMMGIVIINYAPKSSHELFNLLKSFSIPIYVMFFVLVGARLGISNMPPWLWIIVFVYILARSFGKIAGASLGAKISHADPSVQKYTGLGLFCQGGVAIGLSIVASQHMGNIMITPDLSLGDMIIFGITSSTLIVQLIGPSLVKLAIKLSKEIGRNITEEDVITSLNVNEVMEKDIITIPENLKINHVFKLFSDHRFVAYPVTDPDRVVKGIITLHTLKDILTDPSCWDWMVASDATMPVNNQITSATPLKNALDILTASTADSLPVVDDTMNNHLLGMLDKRSAENFVKQELIRRQSNMVMV